MKNNIFAFIVLLGITLSSCGLSPEENTPSVQLVLHKTIYQVGDKFDGEFIVKNNSDEDMHFEFNDAKRYGLIIEGENNLKFEINLFYAQVVSNIILKSKDEFVLSFNWGLMSNEVSFKILSD